MVMLLEYPSTTRKIGILYHLCELKIRFDVSQLYDAHLINPTRQEFGLKLEESSIRLAPFQSRLISLRITQRKSISPSLEAIFPIFQFASGVELKIRVPLTHKRDWNSNPDPGLVIRHTHRSPILSDSVVVPPLQSRTDAPVTKPILALHGAGVDVNSILWTSSIRRREHEWVVFARGLTPWGYDWRGPSAQDALAALDALRQREVYIAPTAVVVGHSNGGQGTFHLASHYPDIFDGSIPIAAYLTAPSYVPTIMSHGAHFIDPALQGILTASLAGGDNDLFLGNMASRRARVFHGGDDENVPVWNSRKAVDIIHSYNETADVS